ncbi:MAG: hypothetical protein KBG15_14750 [Kofleriaceae bacterium]|nr:hypothetical protein [Kofleriaceae bacterium]
MRLLCAVFVVAVLATSESAWALSQAEHQRITEQACLAERMSDGFCKRMANAAFSVDGYEWRDMAAHAQRELEQPACEAANRSAQRVNELADSAVAAYHAGADEVAADEFGRALHTLQDECAHHGMSNRQHAHFSLLDVCGETGASPDAAPEAKQCAVKRTKSAMIEIANAVAGRPPNFTCSASDRTTMTECGRIAGPSPIEVCEFLGESTEWNGEDTRWQPIVGERMLSAFKLGFRGIDPSSVCADGTIATEPPVQLVHAVAHSCALVAVTCLGKVDNPMRLDEDSVAAEGGCAAAGRLDDASSGLALLFAMVVLAAPWRRRAGMA